MTQTRSSLFFQLCDSLGHVYFVGLLNKSHEHLCCVNICYALCAEVSGFL